AEAPGVPVVPLGGQAIEIEGYLGDFKIHLGEAGQANFEMLAVDLILDLSTEPLLDRAMTPPGYFTPQQTTRNWIGRLPPLGR
ncbi:MAG: hypothetical protein MI756_14220, partial [Chromatiales bacterium]|nr:hypothetical protein [Chromatiales bacterium]